jgi:lysozyme
MAVENRKSIATLLITAALTGSVMLYEAYSPVAYIPIPNDKVTVGYGSTEHLNGTPIKLGEKIDRKTADVYLMHDLDKFKTGMSKCVTAPLSQNEFNAILSLTYNIGTSAFCSSSIPRKLNAGNYKEACLTILHFNKVRDYSKPRVKNPQTGLMQYQYKVLKGLDNRRKQEYNTCTSPQEGLYDVKSTRQYVR